MSVLASIRNRAGLLVAVVGIALFAFVLGDIFSSQSIFSAPDDSVGKIGGKKITYNEFNFKVEEAIERHKKNSEEGTVEEQVKDMLIKQTWDNMVNDLVMKREFENLGLAVHDDELYDMITGNNPHPYVIQYFTDRKTGKIFEPYSSPTGMLNVAKVGEYAQQMNPEQEASWVILENGIKEARIAEKYNTLIKKGIYITSSQAKREYIDDNKTFKAKYIIKRYSYVPDSSVTVSESDLKNYYSAHQNEYKIKETSRKIDYVVFEAFPSAEDTANIKDDLAKLAEEFKSKKEKEDSSFVIRESDSRNFDISFHKKGTLSPTIDSIMFGAEAGSVVGPYIENNQIKISKLIAIKNSPDSVNARHILIRIEADTIGATRLADSLKKVVNSKNFAELAKKYSADPGSGVKGGDLGWFPEEGQGSMVPEFSKAAFNGKVGDITMVTSQYGIHIIEILDKTAEIKKVQVGTIERNILPSTKTLQVYYLQASEFAGKNNSKELFEKAIDEKKLDKRVADNVKEGDKTIPGLESPRDVVKWMYESKAGDISPAFELGNKFIVANLVEVREKGIASFDQVREQVEAKAKQEKKAQDFIDKYNKVLGEETTLENIAIKMDEQIMDIENLKFTMSSIPGLGKEGVLIGAAVTLKPKVVSKPIKGRNGVYVVLLEEVKEPTPITDYTAFKNKAASTISGRVDNEVFEALKENANIEDRKSKFY